MINYLAVLVCGVVSMAVGFIWYGPLFGKAWMKIMGAETMSGEQKDKMRKDMWKYYITQFVLSLFQIFVLAWYIITLKDISDGVHTAFSLWIAFVMPTVAGAALWSGKPKKVAWRMFFISAGAQLVSFILFGLILGAWK